MFHHFTLETTSKNQTINISGEIENLIEKNDIKNGVIIIYTPHTTCGIMINEGYDANVQRDFLSHIKKLIPADSDFKHMEGNSDAHIKSALIGTSQTIIIDDGQMQLGQRQAIFFCEFDGPRDRQVYIKFIEG